MSRQATSEAGQRSDASRRQLVDIAIDCFALHGFQGTSIARIARAAGVTKGALYYHFRDKEDLLLEAVKNRIGEFELHFLDAVAASDDAFERLKRVVDACFFTATASNHRRFIITLMVEALDINRGCRSSSGRCCAGCAACSRTWSPTASDAGRCGPTWPPPMPRH